MWSNLYRWRWPLVGAMVLVALVVYARLNPTYEGISAYSPTPSVTATQSVSLPSPSPSERAGVVKVSVPDVTYQPVANAREHLRARGFKVNVRQRLDLSAFTYRQGVVVQQQPDFGEYRAGKRVILFVQPACTPGYSPCLPPALDYDCAGGIDDGPKWVYGNVRVYGLDPYGLDGDNTDTAADNGAPLLRRRMLCAEQASVKAILSGNLQRPRS